MSSKKDVRPRMTFPSVLADFLDEEQKLRGLPSRRDVVVEIVREARRRKRHAEVEARRRARRQPLAQGGHTEAPG